MSDDPKKSFTALRRWAAMFDLIARTLLVLAIVVMLNYLGARWFHRCYLNAAQSQTLSPQTLGLLASITNHIKITLFYDRDDPLFPLVSDLLNEYHDANPRLQVMVVDYLRDAGAAAVVKEQYRNVLVGTNKDMVIFDCEGRPPKALPGQILVQYSQPEVDPENPVDPETGSLRFKQRKVFFLGQQLFNGALLVVLNPKPLRAYFVSGHGEQSLNDQSSEAGFAKFKTAIQNNHIEVEPISLLSTNVPADCSLLILAGPMAAYTSNETERVTSYLREGGRLLALANSIALPKESGLEQILAAYGIDLRNEIVSDPKNASSASQRDLYADTVTDHPISAPLAGSRVRFWMPRPFFQIPNLPADAPRVQTLILSSEFAFARPGNLGPMRFPLAVAVEKGAVKNVITERGSTRIVAIGDSIMFGNSFIEDDANRDFLNFSINWLVDRSQMMTGISPKPMDNYRLSLTASQLRSASWLMLAAVPGAVLALGGIVWLRRRK